MYGKILRPTASLTKRCGAWVEMSPGEPSPHRAGGQRCCSPPHGTHALPDALFNRNGSPTNVAKTSAKLSHGPALCPHPTACTDGEQMHHILYG